jgi:hypothetical protein
MTGVRSTETTAKSLPAGGITGGRMNTMTDPQQAAAQGAQAAQEVQRILELFIPNASNIQIKNVNQTPRQIEITDFRADLPDGSSVYAPHLTIRRG